MAGEPLAFRGVLVGNGVGRGEVTPGSALGTELRVVLERAMHAGNVLPSRKVSNNTHVSS